MAQQREGGVERAGLDGEFGDDGGVLVGPERRRVGKNLEQLMGRSLCEDGMQRLERAVDVEQFVLDEQDEINNVTKATARTIDVRAREGVHLLGGLCRLTSMSSTDRAPMPAKLRSRLASVTCSVGSDSSLRGATSSFSPSNCLPASDA